jgi:spore coat polysaccharide biosynthesis protein SpsF (cytidylyltransferase family)
MLKWIVDRIYSVQEVDDVVVATTTNLEDDVLIEWLLNNGIKYFRGSEEDVLSRFYFCAKEHAADIIIRITADDPLKDPSLISRAITFLVNDNSIDYCSNTINPTYPEGLDVEVFRWGALEKAYCSSRLPSEREHVTPFIWKNSNLFKLKNFEFERNLSHWRWTVDKPSDLEFIRAIYTEFRNTPLISYIDIIYFLEENPTILAINSSETVRNEGYLKSIEKEIHGLKS